MQIFKLKVIRHSKETNNCVESKEYSISMASEQKWRKDKEQLLAESYARKALCVMFVPEN
jgi:hypothetical protein